MRREKPIFTVVIDTREQAAYSFGAPHRRELLDGGTLRYALSEGDYACEVDGVLLTTRIERKSVSDFFGVCGHGRERFERELERLRRFSSWLIIEATPEHLKQGFERSMISGDAALGSALSWAVKFGIHPIFAGGRREGNGICRRILEYGAVEYLRKLKESSDSEGKK